MFTGIVAGQGKILHIDDLADAKGRTMTLCVSSSLSLAMGDSLACDGVCLTVVGFAPATHPGERGICFDIGFETLQCTTAKTWKEGDLLNVEGALRLGDALGGHMVTGHVDAITHVLTREQAGETLLLGLAMPKLLESMIASKGSVALNGVSLTVNAVHPEGFGVGLIPHTCAVTNLGRLMPGDACNLEVDLLARYVARHLKQGSYFSFEK